MPLDLAGSDLGSKIVNNIVKDVGLVMEKRPHTHFFAVKKRFANTSERAVESAGEPKSLLEFKLVSLFCSRL